MTTISLSKEQFKKLAIMTYIGNWVMNASKLHTDKDYDKEADNVLHYLSTFARENNMDKYVKDFEEHGLDWTIDFDNLCHEYIDPYKIDNMFDELAEGLTYRDFEKKFGKYPDFRNNEHDRKEFYKIRDFWDLEFEKYSLERIGIIN